MTSPMLIAHCDWSTAAAKRWMAVGIVGSAGDLVAGAAEPVGDPATLVDRLQARADGAALLIGFDFPIGVPRRYADLAGIDAFPTFLRKLASGQHRQFFRVAGQPDEISVDRPFYPRRPTGSKRQHLVDRLAVDDFTQLLRVCERRHGTRPAAAPLFWLVGAKQVGKAAMAGWRDVLAPALGAAGGSGLWPFDGGLRELLATRRVVMAETYPAEVVEQLGLRLGAGGKRDRSGRRPACDALLDVAATLGVKLSDAARAELDGAFGDASTGEDRFDAFVGLLGVINVVLGRRDEGPPSWLAPDVAAVEGWILGQGPDAAACLA